MLLLFLACIILPVTADAHTGIKSSVPASGETVQTELSTIEMVFNTKIEDLSSFDLLGEHNEKIPLQEVSVEGTVMSGTLSEALPSGSYKIEWKIVGEDGHPIKGEIPFSVQLTEAENPENPENPESPADSSGEQTPSSADGTDEQAPSPEDGTETADQAEDSSNELGEEQANAQGQPDENRDFLNPTLIVVLAAVCIAGLGVILWIRGRGKG
ncbi:copper resistance CopC family protein [Paenibacillus sambharensis]|nr:copper resistance CopC family protein [Paenibacillus sambharensis]